MLEFITYSELKVKRKYVAVWVWHGSGEISKEWWFPQIHKHVQQSTGMQCYYDVAHLFTQIFEKVANENLSAFPETTPNHGFYGTKKV